jgi:cytochrome c-type biogenesis protein
MIATLPSSLLAALPIAVAAGFVSFISPCVLPLLPGYLAFLSGAAGSLEGRSGRGRAVIGAIAFIIGFAIVFVSIGAIFGGFGQLLRDHERILAIVFGSVTILLGMFFGGWWPSKWLNRDLRIHHLPRASIVGAGALGFLFALGWTPCLGPTLAAINALDEATSGATALRGSILAFFYCLGLGIPFIVAALATEWVSTASSWLRRHQRTIGRIGGALLIVIGILEVTGAWNTFVIWLQVHFPSTTAPF